MLPHRSAVAGLAVAMVMACPVPTRADEGAAVASLDESTFLSRVRDRAPRRAALEQRRVAAGALVGVASVLPNPTLSYEREAVPGISASDDFIRLGWVLDLAGRRGIATAAAGAAADAERRDVERDSFVFEADARLAFLDALHARAHLARLDDARTNLGALVDALRSRAQQGDASSYDADRATLELEQLDDERATVSRQLATARLRLGTLMGEAGTPYDAAGTLVLPAKPGVTEPQRPDVDAARARAMQADHEGRAAARRWVPRLELMAGMLVSRSSGGDGVGYVVGIGGELPVFDRGGAAAERARADARRWRAEAAAIAYEARGEAAQLRREVELRIEQADRYQAGPATRAADLQRRASVAYREGDRPILELLDVQRTARHTQVRALELVYEARRADIQLQRALGRQP